MMRIAALSIGHSAAVGDFDGRVEAAYARACVLMLNGYGLLTLVTSTIGRVPRGIVIDAPSEFTFASSIAIGAPVAARSGILRIRDTALAIDLRPAPSWRSALGALNIDGTSPAVLLAREAAMAALRQDGRSDLFVRIGGAPLTALDAAVRALDVAAAEKAMSRLIGLGEGLTPAGDDYLVGYAAGLWACAGTDESRLNFVVAFSGALKRVAAKAGKISRVYLEAAAEGEVSERLFTLASNIADGSGGAVVSRTVAAALAVGHSSGACSVCGFLRACGGWSNDPRRGSR
jgi:hypothetical protein